MPFKANAARRHHIPKQRYRVRNWQEYDVALRARGSPTVWFSDEAVERWRAETRSTSGGQRTYSDLAILTALTLRAVYRLDAATGLIVAATLTDHEVNDASQVGPLLNQIAEPFEPVIADGAYDRSAVYEAVNERHPGAAVVVPPRSTAVPSDIAQSDPTPRDRHLQFIADGGRRAWQATSGHNLRALAEAFFRR